MTTTKDKRNRYSDNKTDPPLRESGLLRYVKWLDLKEEDEKTVEGEKLDYRFEMKERLLYEFLKPLCKTAGEGISTALSLLISIFLLIAFLQDSIVRGSFHPERPLCRLYGYFPVLQCDKVLD